ncbi:SCO2322 family protein [Mariniluteicoccus endophyticus]
MYALRRLAAALLVAIGALSLIAPPAHAEDGYRYWSFWQATGTTWDYAQKGADGIVPDDGQVLGWRFASAGMNDRRTPRAAGDFAQICAAAPAEDGKKRVAVVIDQGTPADAPIAATDKPDGKVNGTCVVAAPEATAADVLAQVADVRKEKGKTCGIGGYPATACTDAVRIDAPAKDETLPLTVTAPKGSSKATAAPAPAPDTAEKATPVLPWVLAAAVLLVLAAGTWWMRRRRTDENA